MAAWGNSDEDSEGDQASDDGESCEEQANICLEDGRVTDTFETLCLIAGGSDEEPISEDSEGNSYGDSDVEYESEVNLEGIKSRVDTLGLLPLREVTHLV